MGNLGRRNAASSPSDSFSQRKIKVPRLVATGPGNPTIAKQLIIGEKTTKPHILRISSQMGFTAYTEAIADGVKIRITLS